ncbi:hypothetical protein BC628DRAFT_728545 [Trametes gibbosa]|nr:hypothetical protein BC628DRAFT_728545 [Trametes gibbosa]
MITWSELLPWAHLLRHLPLSMLSAPKAYIPMESSNASVRGPGLPALSPENHVVETHSCGPVGPWLLNFAIPTTTLQNSIALQSSHCPARHSSLPRARAEHVCNPSSRERFATPRLRKSIEFAQPQPFNASVSGPQTPDPDIAHCAPARLSQCGLLRQIQQPHIFPYCAELPAHFGLLEFDASPGGTHYKIPSHSVSSPWVPPSARYPSSSYAHQSHGLILDLLVLSRCHIPSSHLDRLHPPFTILFLFPFTISDSLTHRSSIPPILVRSHVHIPRFCFLLNDFQTIQVGCAPGQVPWATQNAEWLLFRMMGTARRASTRCCNSATSRKAARSRNDAAVTHTKHRTPRRQRNDIMLTGEIYGMRQHGRPEMECYCT